MCRALVILVLWAQAACSGAAEDPLSPALAEALSNNDPVALEQALAHDRLYPDERSLAEALLASYRPGEDRVGRRLKTLSDAAETPAHLRRIALLSHGAAALRTGRYRAAASSLDAAAAIPAPFATAEQAAQTEQVRALVHALRAAPDLERVAHGDAVLPVSTHGRARRATLPLVEVRMNGKPVETALDTGAALSVLSESLAAHVGLRAGEDTGLVEGAAAQVAVRPAILAELEIGATRLRNVAVLVVPDHTLRFGKRGQLHAVAGVQVLERLGRLTYEETSEGSARFRIEAAGRKPSRRRDPEDRPLYLVGMLPIVTAEVEGVREPLRWFLDTGAVSTSLQPRSLEEFAQLRRRAKPKRLRVWGAGGERRVAGHIIPELTIYLGPQHVRVLDLKVMPFGAARQHGTLGHEVLSATGGYTLDFEEGRLWLR